MLDNFNLPENLSSDQKYSKLIRLAAWASERAKIDLSMKTESLILLNEDEIRIQDNSGKDIYMDISITRSDFDPLIKPKIVDTINATRDMLEKAHLTPHDIDRIVFIGGPTHYKPLRDMVSFELGISTDTQVNPMTAVAEGAAIFAESIDWSSEKKERKSSRGSIAASGKLNLSFDYTSRTSDIRARIAVQCGGQILPGSTFQIDNLETGWDSGRINLKDGAFLTVDLTKNGENRFKVWVFDPSGGSISIENNIMIITRTAATIDAIPASHSIGVQVRETMKGTGTTLRYLVRKGDSLPKKGSETFNAAVALRAKGQGSLNFILREGEIETPIEDNEHVGDLLITGADFDTGVIEPGAELICEYEVSDSGRVSLLVSVPSVGTLKQHDFYSRGVAPIDYSNAGHRVISESEALIERADNISEKVDDERLDIVRNKLQESRELAQNENDPETTKLAMQNVDDAKSILAKVRKDHLPSIRQIDLDNVTNFFQNYVKKYAKSSEITSFDNMARSAKLSLERPGSDFENMIEQMRGMNWQILWRQDWFIVDTFKRFSNEEYLFTDKVTFGQLVKVGSDAIKRDDIDKLREVVFAMYGIRITTHTEQDLNLETNIL